MSLMKTLPRLVALIDAGDAETYSVELRRALQEGLADSLIHRLDDRLLSLLNDQPVYVETLVSIHIQEFAGRGLTEAEGYAWCTKARACALLEDAPGFVSAVASAADIVERLKLLPLAVTLEHAAMYSASPQLMVRDAVLPIRARLVRIFVELRRPRKAAKLLCTAAFHFCAVGAFQPAYRALDDARRIAEDVPLKRGMATVIEAHAYVGTAQGDHEYAAENFKRAIAYRRNTGLKVPLRIYLNLATCYMRLGDHAAAELGFEQLLDAGLSGKERLVARMNRSACLRELGRHKEAQNALAPVLSKRKRLDDEFLHEVLMIQAKNLVAMDDFDIAGRVIREALDLQWGSIDAVGRLHFRRGLRSKLVRRLVAIILKFPVEGPLANIIAIVAYVKSTAIGDWLSLLDFESAFQESKDVDEAAKEQLALAIRRVAAQGAPVRYGFYEKYDDPFEVPLSIPGPDGQEMDMRAAFGGDWDDLNEAIEAAKRAGAKGDPYDSASLPALISVLNESLAAPRAIVMFMHLKGVTAIVTMVGSTYLRHNVESDVFVAFLSALRAHGLKSNLASVNSRLAAATKALDGWADAIAPLLLVHDIAEVLVLPGPLTEMYPVVPAFMRRESLRTRMAGGQLSVRVCPVLYKQRVGKTTGEMIGIMDSSDSLKLPASELRNITAAFKPQAYQRIDLAATENFSWDALGSAGYVHIASHGNPITQYTDPWFAEIRPGMPLPELQACWPWSSARLVFVNACHAGLLANRNFQDYFITEENVGFNSLFLLSRVTEVVAPSWGTIDVAAFVFASTFYGLLAGGMSIAQSCSAALADMYTMPLNRAIECLGQIDLQPERERLLKTLSASGDEFPFRRDYIVGAYQCITLLG